MAMDNIASLPANGNGISWHLPYEAPMRLLGFNWFEKYRKYHRLPDELPNEVTVYPDGVKNMCPKEKCGAFSHSLQTAGGQVRFRTNSRAIHISGSLTTTDILDHMPLTGSAGFDLYLKCNGVWKFFGVSRTDHTKLDFSAELISGLKREMRDAIIHFPLYNGVSSLAVGLEEDALLEEPTPFADERPILWYGTSIQQGACASRPGMCASNLVSRWLDRPVLSFGFNGSGVGQPEIAEMLADVQNPGMYIIDYTWNVTCPSFRVTLPQFVDIIRRKHADTLILLMGPTPGRCIYEEIESKTRLQELADRDLKTRNDIMRDEASRRIASGDRHIAFFDALNNSLGEDFWDATVDGCHPTDLGFYRLSQALCHFMKNTAHNMGLIW
ncbi:MAG: SGNH/GDSL hydrolase family protein [Victivallales bacterium]|nr:SGNH/GDSL hydrolase family protein [Victivallales bacterium]